MRIHFKYKHTHAFSDYVKNGVCTIDTFSPCDEFLFDCSKCCEQKYLNTTFLVECMLTRLQIRTCLTFIVYIHITHSLMRSLPSFHLEHRNNFLTNLKEISTQYLSYLSILVCHIYLNELSRWYKRSLTQFTHMIPSSAFVPFLLPLL